MNPATEEKQCARLSRIRAERNQEAAQAALSKVEASARDGVNLMPPIIDAVRNWATLGEIADAMRRVFGEYRPANEV
jgi:methylmalonyl-CoA mutase N-terminal domain/subunit